VHEQDHYGACPEHSDTRWFAQAVLGRCSQHDVYLIDRETSVPLNCEIFEETWADKEVNLNHLRTFDCISYVHIELSHRSKLDPKSRRCIFIGYEIDEYDIDSGISRTA